MLLSASRCLLIKNSRIAASPEFGLVEPYLPDFGLGALPWANNVTSLISLAKYNSIENESAQWPNSCIRSPDLFTLPAFRQENSFRDEKLIRSSRASLDAFKVVKYSKKKLGMGGGRTGLKKTV